jgi:7-carboxy-7-deazaguanine synthase
MENQQTYEVVEHFTSINGEGPLAGQLAVFIRFKGCNLSCSYCDTTWANEPDAPATAMTAHQIYEMILETGIRNVTLTGGEPLDRPGMKPLLEILCSDPSLKIEIETNGSIDLAPYTSICHRPAFTMDYKLACSGMEQAMLTDNFDLLDSKDTVKFVVGSLEDCERALHIIRHYQLTGRCHLFLSPVFGSIEPAQIVEFMKENRMNDVHLQIQMHKVIWAPDQRGV